MVGEKKLPSDLSKEGVEVVDGREAPPSRNLSEGGDRSGVSTEETPPLPCISSKGGGGGGVSTENPLHLTI